MNSELENAQEKQIPDGQTDKGIDEVSDGRLGEKSNGMPTEVVEEIENEMPDEAEEFDWGDEEEEKDKKNPFSNLSATGVLNRIGDILLLHFAVLLCSIPVVTIGASLTAGAYVGMKMAGGMEGGVLGNFIKAFRLNFRRSTAYFIIIVTAFFAICMSFKYWSSMDGSIGSLMSCTSVCLAVLWVMFVLYIFAVQAKFENTFTGTAKNAILMAIRHLHITILMTLIVLAIVYLIVNFMGMQAIMAVSGFGILFFILGKAYNTVFASYIK